MRLGGLLILEEVFLKIFQNAACIWVRKSDERRFKSTYKEYLSKCLFITDSNGWVKILPNLDTSKRKLQYVDKCLLLPFKSVNICCCFFVFNTVLVFLYIYKLI
ncbi:hypothetical protein Goshw_024902 [Gossypium schwendimanii]|uniref:Uncharacterized protein n=1 Tax=Gossypium schwendimanii TaxID=34291 RepID=A0A7J9KN01_GOSSC|nr:hypothetical protein [Gossypium schwendimanii]